MLTSLGIGFVVYKLYDDALILKERGSLREEALQHSLPIKTALRSLQSDVLFLSGTPPVQGILRATLAGGIDPEDGSSTKIWQHRLDAIFSSMLSAKAEYMQIRYIGVADQGRELVRVERKKGAAYVCSEHDLQSKQNEPYMQDTVLLNAGELYFSKFNLNREYGKIVHPNEPVVRVATPVYGPDNRIFGIVIINMRLMPLFKNLQGSTHKKYSLYVVNESGDFLFHPQPEHAFGFEFGKEVRVQDQIPELENTFAEANSNHDVSLMHKDEKAIHFHKIFFDSLRKNRYLGLVIEVPFQELLVDNRILRYQSLGAILVFVLFGSVVAYLITRQLTRPLTQLSESADQVARGEYTVSLPDKAVGEVQILANAFRVMISRIQERTELLQDSESRIRAIMEAAVEGIVTIDEQGNIETANDAVEEIFGYGKNDLLGKNIKMLMPSPDREKHDGYLKRYLDTGEKHIIGSNREALGLHKNGTLFPIDLAVSEVNFTNRRVFSGLIRDITERKQYEQKLQLLSHVVEHNPSLIIVTNPQGIIEYVNLKFTEITGYTPQEAIGQNPSILKSGHASQEDYQQLWETISTGKEWRGEVNNRKKDGQDYWAHVSISSITNEKDQITHYIGIQEDITDRKRLDLDLRQSKERAEQANQAKSTFLASMSHELRTPLNSILGFAQVLKFNKQKSLSEKELGYTSHILESGNLLLDLINDVLDLSKVESGKYDLSMKPVLLSNLFVEAIDQIGSLVSKHHIDVSYADQNLDQYILADERGIRQVLNNLLSNAIKYNKEKGEVKLSCHLIEDEYVQIDVSDTGCGIPEEKMELLFQPFNRLGAEASNIEGTGIGLTICKRLVDLMGGSISVESELGKGTTFHVKFTLADKPPEPEEKVELRIDAKLD